MVKPFFVWQNKVLKKIYPTDVVFLTIEQNYTKLVLRDGGVCLVRSTLSGALQKLPQDMFVQVHRSYAVSIYYIDDIDKDHINIADAPIPIGKQYYKPFLERLNIMD